MQPFEPAATRTNTFSDKESNRLAAVAIHLLPPMFFRPSSPSISVSDLHARLDTDDAPVLLDIRSAPERAQGSLGGLHIEMDSLPSRLSELSAHQDNEIVVYCRSGNRSAAVVRFLRANGYPNAVNLAGGLAAWAQQIR